MTQDQKSSDVLPALKPSDHPDLIGGWVWRPMEIEAIQAYAREAVALALAAQKAVPAGWKLVPVEPTAEMLNAVRWDEDAFGGKSAWPSDIYKAMLAAAPSTPPSEAEQAEAPAFNLDPTPISGWGQQPIGMSTTLAKCPACHGTGAIGIPGAPCPFCKIHELGNLTGKTEQAEAPSERVTAGGGFVGDHNGVLTARIKELEGIIEKLTDSECDKIMAMTDAQISALHRMEGHDPEDIAKLGQLTARLAIRDVQVAQLRATLPPASKAEPVAPVVQERDTYDSIWNALQEIDSAAVFLPTFQVKHEGGIEAFTRNIVEAIQAVSQQPEASGAGERTVMEDALAGLEYAKNNLPWGYTGIDRAIERLRAALASKPPAVEQKPVAHVPRIGLTMFTGYNQAFHETFTIHVDPDMPADEVQFRQGDQILCRLILDGAARTRGDGGQAQ